MSYVLSVTERLNWLVFSFAETENQMVSLERVLQIIGKTPQESDGTLQVSNLKVLIEVTLIHVTLLFATIIFAEFFFLSQKSFKNHFGPWVYPRGSLVITPVRWSLRPWSLRP